MYSSFESFLMFSYGLNDSGFDSNPNINQASMTFATYMYQPQQLLSVWQLWKYTSHFNPFNTISRYTWAGVYGKCMS